MKLRKYIKEDADIICRWIRTEDELYRWSADRFNIFPLTGDDIENNYEPGVKGGRFFPVSAVDDAGTVVGHLIIRYPKEDDDSTVRFGFVIVDPSIRGKGYGKKMLSLATQYVKDNFNATRIDLGVFDNNPSAKGCYEAVGFKEYQRRECNLPIGNWTCIDMEMYLQ